MTLDEPIEALGRLRAERPERGSLRVLIEDPEGYRDPRVGVPEAI
jgi:hypothetical protein